MRSVIMCNYYAINYRRFLLRLTQQLLLFFAMLLLRILMSSYGASGSGSFRCHTHACSLSVCAIQWGVCCCSCMVYLHYFCCKQMWFSKMVSIFPVAHSIILKLIATFGRRRINLKMTLRVYWVGLSICFLLIVKNIMKVITSYNMQLSGLINQIFLYAAWYGFVS